MPYEVSMSGGFPWGFRLAGGPFAGKPVTVSRITPGGKAAQANVMQGDILVSVNGFNISHLDLPQLMNMIKATGCTLHLTLISQDEISQVKKKRVPEINITDAIEYERPTSTPLHSSASTFLESEVLSRATSRLSENNKESNEEEANVVPERTSIAVECNEITKSNEAAKEDENLPTTVEACPASDPTPVEHPSPKPRKSKIVEKPNVDNLANDPEQIELKPETNEKKQIPDFVRRQLRTPKPMPTFKPQVYWLHDKLRLTPKPQNGLKNPGQNLKMAASAYPSRKIEIEGPLSATIVHSQYNTPVGMYSPTQIVNTLVNTAVATGTKFPNPYIFGDNDVDVDRSTAVYKMVHNKDRTPCTPAQSPSIQILDALLEHGKEVPRKTL